MTSSTTESRRRTPDLAALRKRLVDEQRRLERLLREVEEALQKAPSAGAVMVADQEAAPPRPGPLDQVKGVMAATADLRLANGNLSAERVAKLFGVSLSQLAGWLGRTRQSLSKTPDADSLQPALSYFERVARLRLVIRNEAEFRKWLRMPNELLGNKSPLDLMARRRWQHMADYVDDALTGAPT